jgi:hypothetical protein
MVLTSSCGAGKVNAGNFLFIDLHPAAQTITTTE